MDWMKVSRDEPSRALLEQELASFTDGNPLWPFVALVQEHEELELCFRGNDKRNPRVCIYAKNHIVFTVLTSGKTLISFDHARYCENWRQYYERLTAEFGFSGRIRTDEKGFLHIGELSRSLRQNEPFSKAELHELYEDIIKPIFDRYFEAEELGRAVDYFKRGSTVRVAGKKEKRRQQELFHHFTFTRNGYFFYDMEFSERHSDLEDQRRDPVNNKPDMLALRLDAQGKPDRLTFVEVKSTATAMGGDSGLLEHLRKMRDYGHLDDRRREACQIMHQYARLGLRGLSGEAQFPFDDFSALPLEILFAFTDEAIALWEERPAFSSLRRQACEIDAGIPWAKLCTVDPVREN